VPVTAPVRVGLLPRGLDEGLGSQIIDLRGFDCLDHSNQAGEIDQVSIMQHYLVRHTNPFQSRIYDI
jgi:hypothetical protein